MAIAFFEANGGLIRIILYFAFLLWSILLFILCIARLGYTDHRRNEPSLNGGAPFYDPSVVELLVCAFLGTAFSIFILDHLWFRNAKSTFTRNWFEVACQAILWLLWLGGAAAASTVWPDLSWCVQYSPCVVLQFLMAWAWLGWITLSLLFFPTLFIVARSGAWDSPHFDVWGKRTLQSDVQEWRNRRGVNRMRDTEEAPRIPPKDSAERGKGRNVEAVESA